MADCQIGGRVRALDDGDLSLFEVEHTTGGAVIRMDESLQARWQMVHNLEPVDIPMDGSSNIPVNIYAPFASEDWRIAEWVVKESGQHRP